MLGWKTLLACCVLGLLVYYFVSFLMFRYGWERLDPMCREDPRTSYTYVVGDRYTTEAVQEIESVISAMFTANAVWVDDGGVVYVRPIVYHGYFGELDRFPQLVVRPDDEPHLYQTRRITCDELQSLIQSPIDTVEREVLHRPVSFFAIVRQPDSLVLQQWLDRHRRY